VGVYKNKETFSSVWWLFGRCALLEHAQKYTSLQVFCPLR